MPPPNFLQVPVKLYNDVLNNYRVVLGEYQFRRCLFAKKFLFNKNWDHLIKFAFSREPTDQCLSQFFYLFYRPGIRSYLRSIIRTRKPLHPTRRINYEFDYFLSMIEACRESESNFSPASLSFQTHTAAMHSDICDEDGEVLLDYIFRLEDFPKGVRFIVNRLGVASSGIEDGVHVNTSKRKDSLVKLDQQRKAKITKLFRNDFDIYENAFVNWD